MKILKYLVNICISVYNICRGESIRIVLKTRYSAYANVRGEFQLSPSVHIIIIIAIKLLFITCLNKKNLAQKCITEKSLVIIILEQIGLKVCTDMYTRIMQHDVFMPKLSTCTNSEQILKHDQTIFL